MLGKHTLKPQETTSLKITYHTEGRPGPFRKHITVTTDVPGHDELEITMEGSVKEALGAKIQVSPKKAELGTVKVGDVVQQVFTVTNAGLLPLVISRIAAKSGSTVYYDGTGEKGMVIAPGESRQVKLSISPSKSGQFTEIIIINSNARNAGKGGFVIMAVGTAGG